VWRLRPPSISLPGATFRGVASPKRDARVFRPSSRVAGPPRSTIPPLGVDPEAAHSLRPSAGGAHVGSAPRAHDVALKHPSWWSPNRHYAYSGARIGIFRSGLMIEKPVSRAPSTESLWLDKGSNRIALAFTKWELCNDLATLALPSTLSALPNDLEPRPGSSTFVCVAFSLCSSARLRAVHKDRSPRSCPRLVRSSFSTHPHAASHWVGCTRLAGRRASLGLAAYLGHGAKMLGSVSTTDVHVTSTR